MLNGIMVLAVQTGVVVIVVAVAVVFVVVLVTASMRGSQRRGAARRGEARHDLDEAEERVERAEHERDVALGGRDTRSGDPQGSHERHDREQGDAPRY